MFQVLLRQLHIMGKWQELLQEWDATGSLLWHFDFRSLLLSLWLFWMINTCVYEGRELCAGAALGARGRRSCRRQSVLPTSWCTRTGRALSSWPSTVLKCPSELRLMLFLSTITETCLWPHLSVPHTVMWLRSPISMLVHTLACWISGSIFLSYWLYPSEFFWLL